MDEAYAVWIMAETSFESFGTLLGVLTPLLVVPLTVITFYLRSLREQQTTGHGEVVRRVESIERTAEGLRDAITNFERDFTTKEEWLRECMLARQTLNWLSKKVVQMETAMDAPRHSYGGGACEKLSVGHRHGGPDPAACEE